MTDQEFREEPAGQEVPNGQMLMRSTAPSVAQPSLSAPKSAHTVAFDSPIPIQTWHRRQPEHTCGGGLITFVVGWVALAVIMGPLTFFLGYLVYRKDSWFVGGAMMIGGVVVFSMWAMIVLAG